jgi:GH24 family phage-related lysozyme (muramidase)
MVDYAIANQIRPFQLPNIAGIAGAMQGLELNRMRSQQLQAAEQERNALRGLMADPNFDISSPEASRRILQVAPTIGGPAYNAALSGRRELRQSEAAAAEATLKNFDLSRESLRGIATLPEGDRQAAWEAWRARTEATVPGTRGFIPPAYSDEAFAAMISKADEIARNLTERPTALQGPGGVPVLVDRRTGTFRMGTEVPGAGVAAPPAAPTAAPRAEGPPMSPGQTAAADFLRRREGFRDTPYYDVNAFRAGYGSDTATLADGTVVPVRQGMTVSREDAERDLTRRIPEFERRVVSAVGQDQYAALPPNAQAALISIAYNYGTLPGSIRAAARSGDPAALAQAVAGLAGDNEGVNAIRRREEAAMIAGTPVNVMSGRGATTNAMLAPQDATAMNMPQLPTFAPPRTLAEADYQKRMMDMVADLEKKRIEAERRRSEQPERVQEAGQTAGATARAQADVRREEQPSRVEEAGQTVSAQTTARLEAEEAVKRRQDAERLDTAIREVRNLIRPGGLLQQSTGSGVGAGVDWALGQIGVSTRASQAAAQLAPIADMVLKMVPRFEGPQSENDRKSYEAAAGRLADSTRPNEDRLAAARVLIRIMEERRGQFTTNPIAPPGGAASATPTSSTAPTAPPPPPGMSQSDWGRLWGVMKPEERALWQN